MTMSDVAGATSHFAYNENDLQTSVTDALNRVWSTAYDSQVNYPASSWINIRHEACQEFSLKKKSARSERPARF
jgi:YD repeat-containing protein